MIKSLQTNNNRRPRVNKTSFQTSSHKQRKRRKSAIRRKRQLLVVIMMIRISNSSSRETNRNRIYSNKLRRKGKEDCRIRMRTRKLMMRMSS